MTIEVVRSLEGEEGTDAYHHGTEHFVADVEVVMRIARPVPSENAVVRVVGRIFWRQGAKGGPSFHTLEDEVRTKTLAAFHAETPGADVVFLLDALLLHLFVGPLDRNAMIAGESFHPPLVFVGPLGQSLFGYGIQPMHVAEEVDDVLGPRQQGQVALDDDAIETVVYKSQQAAKQLGEGFHRSPPGNLLGTRSSGRGPGGIQRVADDERLPRDVFGIPLSAQSTLPSV